MEYTQCEPSVGVGRVGHGLADVPVRLGDSEGSRVAIDYQGQMLKAWD
jgi:hypothetical protein